MSAVIVYGKENCKPCMRVKAALNRAGVDYSFCYVDKDEGHLQTVKALGAETVPVMVCDDQTYFDSSDVDKVIDWFNSQ